MTLLDSPEDMAWLADVHTPLAKEYACAILYGNEDAPTRLELYARNNIACKPTVLESDDNGDLVLIDQGDK